MTTVVRERMPARNRTPVALAIGALAWPGWLGGAADLTLLWQGWCKAAKRGALVAWIASSSSEATFDRQGPMCLGEVCNGRFTSR